MKPFFTRPRAYAGSLLVHTVVLAVLFGLDHHAGQVRREAVRQQAVRAHAPVLAQTEAEIQTRQLHRMRELAERLAAAEASRRSPGESGSPPSPPGDAARVATGDASAQPEAGERPRDAMELWRESRRDFDATRKRFAELEARRLARIIPPADAPARPQTERRVAPGAGGDGRSAGAPAVEPGSPGDAAAAIARMHDEAQRLLGRALAQGRGEKEGMGLDLSEARAAYVLAQNPQHTREMQGFDRVVDWTTLMGHPLSTASVNGVLEPGDDFRRIVDGRERELNSRFEAGRTMLRFGRRIGASGTEAARWICPDSWYVIGPFENARRESIDRTFPPEIEIDRDASYAGKAGRSVSWEFLRVHTLQVIPPHLEEYAVYYAYTEIRCEQPVDCWLALGGDDYAKLWVNDHLVYSGPKNEKQWSPTEGFRRVHLDAGFNRFLFRLENGWREAEFSLALSLDP